MYTTSKVCQCKDKCTALIVGAEICQACIFSYTKKLAAVPQLPVKLCNTPPSRTHTHPRCTPAVCIHSKTGSQHPMWPGGNYIGGILTGFLCRDRTPGWIWLLRKTSTLFEQYAAVLFITFKLKKILAYELIDMCLQT